MANRFDPPSDHDLNALNALSEDNSPERAVKRGNYSAIESQKAFQLSDQLALELADRLSKGDTIVECCWHLMKTVPGITLPMAQRAVNGAVSKVYGSMKSSDWTDLFKAQAQDLYSQAVKKKRLQAANQILNTAIKVQYLSQQAELRGREMNHEEAKFKAAISLPINGSDQSLSAVISGKGEDSTLQTGFRLQIESVHPTQSIPKEVIEYSKDITPSEDSRDPDNLDP